MRSMSGMLTCILTTTLFHSRGSEARAPSVAVWLERGHRPTPARQSAQLPLRLSSFRRQTGPGGAQARAKHAGAAARSAAPGTATGLLGRRLPLSGPRRQQPGVEPGPPPRSCPEGGARTAAAAFCGRVTSRTLRHAAPPGASPRAARAFPSARGRRYFQRSRVIGLGVVFSG